MAKITSKWKIRRNAYWTVCDAGSFPTEFISSRIKPSLLFGTDKIPSELQMMYSDDLECPECGSSGWFKPRHLAIPEECEEDPNIHSKEDAENYLYGCPTPVFCPRCGAQMIFVEV